MEFCFGFHTDYGDTDVGVFQVGEATGEKPSIVGHAIFVHISAMTVEVLEDVHSRIGEQA